ncbi:MAG: DUF6460 domain-containing protein [Pseudomonadota bacterium]|nr:DUF6460 domain-containing protein [Pseudomonadota bacterium]
MSDPLNTRAAGPSLLTRFLGDTPGRTIVKLAVLSLIVGIIMSALNFTPVELWYALRDFVWWIYDLGYEAFARIGIYFVWGAMVVVPVFLLMRLLNFRGN